MISPLHRKPILFRACAFFGLSASLLISPLHAAPTGGDAEFAEAVRAVADPRGVKALDLNGWTVTNLALAQIKLFSALEELHLNPTLGDGAMDYVRGFSRLRVLDLAGCQVTDAGVAHLAALPNLEEVDLSQTQITDQGLTTLARLPALKTAYLYKTALTAEGIARFSQTRPDVKLIGAALPALPPAAPAVARRPGSNTARPAAQRPPAGTNPGAPAAPETSTEDQEVFRKLNEIAKALRRYAGFKQGNLPEEVDKLRAFLARAEDLTDPWGSGFVYYGEGLNQYNGPEAAPVISTDQPRGDQRWVLTLGGKAQQIPEKNFLALLTRFPNLRPQQAKSGGPSRPVAQATPTAPAAPDAPAADPAAGEPVKLASSGSAILDQQRDRFLEQVRAVDPGRITISPDGHVTELRLADMKLADANLVYLRAMPRLTTLDLSGNNITDGGLNHLLALKKLKRVNLLKTKTTYAGIQPLLQNLPGITLEHDSLR